MWFTKKRIYKQIEEYGKDIEVLTLFANRLLLTDACDLTQDSLKEYYLKHIMSFNSEYQRLSTMLAIRKFYRHLHSSGENCLKPVYISDNPFTSVEFNVTIAPMKKEIKRQRGRPMDIEAIKKTVQLKDEIGLSLREIGKVIKKGRVVDHSQVYKWLIMGRKLSGEVIHRK